MGAQERLSNVEWLLREGARDNPVRVGSRNVIAGESLRAVIECVDLGAGMRVYLTDATALKDVTVEPRATRGGPWIGSQTTIAGRARIDFLDGPRVDADVRNALLFRAARQAAAYSLAAGTRFQSAGYGVDVERVEHLFDGRVPAALSPLMPRHVPASRVVSLRLDQRMRAAARSLFSRDLNGPLRTLMMEGVVIQLLALQAAALGGAPAAPRAALTRREQHRVHEARLLLLSDMRAPPSLGALAALVSLSEKKLNAGFKAQFGGTVYETLRNERLEHARLALEHGALLKDVARLVGYNHVSNFINAFTARYGAPPRRYLGTP